MATQDRTDNNSHANTDSQVDRDAQHVVHAVASKWGWLMAAGAITTVAGMVAFSAPALATAAVGLVLATVILLGGIINLSGVLFADSKSMKLDSALVGIAQILLAVVMFVYPLASIAMLTVIVGSIMLVAGFLRVGWAMATRGLPGWGWSLAGGFATMAVGVLALTGLPGTAVWVIGLLFGVDLLATGVARMAAAWRLRALAKATA